jgi:P2X purinoceptor 4
VTHLRHDVIIFPYSITGINTFYRRNILDRTNKDYLKNCTYDKDDSLGKFCPIFILSEIVRDAGADWDDLALHGGVMGIFINWDCDLDKEYSRCVPEYSFRRMDNKNSTLAKGYSFRYPIYSSENSVEVRTLIKAYGIRFQVLVSGKAGQFNIVPLLLNIGSGIALLGIATVICDLMVMYVVKRRKYYKENKYQLVEDEEALFPLDEQDTNERKGLNSTNSRLYGD